MYRNNNSAFGGYQGSFDDYQGGYEPQRPRGGGRGRRPRGAYGRPNPARNYEEPVARFAPPQRQHTPKTRTTIQKEATPLPKSGPPTPQHLSKVPSEERNDPLYKEAVFPDTGEEFRATSSEFNYYPEAGGLIEIINQIFEVYTAQNPSFAKRVTLSAFTYYCSTLLWARMLYLQQTNNYETDYQDRVFIETLQRADYLVPSPIQLFLDGLGNTTMPEGKDILFRLKEITFNDVNDELGWFDRIQPDTFRLYTAYPCLAALKRRMRHDLEFTADPELDREWIPPAEIHSVVGQGLNTNFYGYQPAVRLSAEQVREYNNMGFYHDRYPAMDNTKYMLCTSLLNHVNSHLRDTTMFEFSSLSDKTSGSLALNIVV